MDSDKILSWLESSGNLLEIRAARVFQNAGFSVSQGYYYADVKTGKIRESDLLVFAQRHCKSPSGKHLTVAVTLMVDCKRSSRKPWAGFISNDTGTSSISEALPFQMMMSPLAREKLAHIMAMNLDQNQNLFELGKSAYAVSTVHFKNEDDKNEKEERNGAYLATQQVLDAAHYRYKESINSNDGNRAHITIPVLVFEGQLLQVVDSPEGPEISQPDEIDLMLRNRFLEHKTDALIKIVSANCLETFVERTVIFMDWLQDLGNRSLAADEATL